MFALFEDARSTIRATAGSLRSPAVMHIGRLRRPWVWWFCFFGFLIVAFTISFKEGVISLNIFIVSLSIVRYWSNWRQISPVCYILKIFFPENLF